jgi:hypothetical protein
MGSKVRFGTELGTGLGTGTLALDLGTDLGSGPWFWTRSESSVFAQGCLDGLGMDRDREATPLPGFDCQRSHIILQIMYFN